MTTALSTKVAKFTNGGLPLNTLAVEANLSNFYAGYRINETGKSEFINERVEELKNIMGMSLTAEKNFFNLLGYKNDDMQQNLKELQNKINSISGQGNIDRLLGINFYSTFMTDPTIRKNIENATTTALTTYLNDEQVSNTIFLDFTGQTVREAIEFLNKKIIVTEGKKSKNYFSSIEGKGLSNYIIMEAVIGNEGKKFKPIFKFTDNAKLDSGIKKKLHQIVEQTIGDTDVLDEEQFREHVNKIIIDTVSGSLKPFIQTQLNNKAGYALNKNENVLKGYVEEICVNAIFSYITNGQSYKGSIPTGAIKEIDTGSSVAIDMILFNYGFQIKSWNLTGGIYTDQKSIGAGTFISNTLQLDYDNFLIDLFGTYQFNQQYDPSYAPIAAQLQTAVNKTPNIFASYLDKIVRQNRKFTGNSQPFLQLNTYYNTFYMINDRLIPASKILSAIIEELEKINPSQDFYNSEVINFKVNNIENSEANTLGSLIESGTRKLKRYGMNIFSMSNLVKIKYELSFNVDALLRRAYEKI